MPEPIPVLLESSSKVLIWISGGILTLLGWILNRQVGRIDILESIAAPKEDIIRLHKKIDENHKAITSRLDRLIDRS